MLRLPTNQCTSQLGIKFKYSTDWISGLIRLYLTNHVSPTRQARHSVSASLIGQLGGWCRLL